MENQEFNRELLDYLYGELNSVQKKEFEKKLGEDKALQKEYEELVAVRKDLSTLEDKEVMEPFSTWGKSRNRQWFQTSPRRKQIVFRPITAVAASVIILFLLGFFTDLSVSVNDQGFYLGFHQVDNVETQKGDYLSKEEVLSLIDEEVRKSNANLIAQLTSVEEEYDIKLASLESSVGNLKQKSQQAGVGKDEITAFFELAENNNAKMIQEYLKTSSQQQQIYFKEMFTQFNSFYREQRESDLAVIQSTFFDINQKQAIQKQETDMALVNLYTAVNNTEE